MLLTGLVCYWVWVRTCIAHGSREHWVSNPQPPLKVSCLVWVFWFGFPLSFFSIYSMCRAASELWELPFPCWRWTSSSLPSCSPFYITCLPQPRGCSVIARPADLLPVHRQKCFSSILSGTHLLAISWACSLQQESLQHAQPGVNCKVWP